MKREMNAGDERLAALLKAADPLREDAGLSRPDAALMKQAILVEAEVREGPGWLPLAAGAALATLSLAAILVAHVPGSPAPGDSGDTGSPGAALRGSEPGAAEETGSTSIALHGSGPDDGGGRDWYGVPGGAGGRYGEATGHGSGRAPGRAARTIHFTTQGGTRIVWTLNPEFEIRTGRRPAPDRS